MTSPRLIFESPTFSARLGEDEKTNPGIFGRALAEWLGESFAPEGFSTDDVIAEDFGWCVLTQQDPHKLYIACASTDESAKEWQVFVFAEGGLISRLLGKSKPEESVAALYSSVRSAIEAELGTLALREEA